MEEILYRYNPWWEKDFSLSDVIPRNSFLEKMKASLEEKDIVFLIGLRRVGKTTLLKSLIAWLIQDHGVDPGRIFYISLDDYTLSSHSILELVETFRKIHKIRFEEKLYLFFDEVTYQKDFEIQLKNLYDQQQVKVYTSASSASLLKRGKPFLTGRSSVLEILPLDFEEYLLFKKIIVMKSDQHLLAGYFEVFLQTGGIPEFVLRGDLEYLKELVDDIILKDIAVAHGIRQPQVLKNFFLLLMERSGKQFSINKMARILGISPDTAKRYLEMFQDSYLIYLIPRFGKTNERLLSPKKIYAADLGIRTLFTGFRDKGSLFENYVYLKLRDRNPSYVFEDSTEIDFLTSEKTLIEVKYGQEMTVKQQLLFEKSKAKKKLIIRGYEDLGRLEE